METYTLYGVCPTCSKGAVSAIDEQGSRPNSTATSNSHNTTTTANTHLDMNVETVPDKLPPGWEPREEPYHAGRTTLILAMSLVLAFVICVLIIACLFWRKSIRRKYKEERDVEGKGKGKARRRNRELSAAEVREAELEKESRVKQKLWARATARWRENVRYTARQRRGKRSSIRSRAARSTQSLDDDDDGDEEPRGRQGSQRSSSIRSVSTGRSRSASRQPSVCSRHDESALESPSLSQESAIPTISLVPAPAPPQSSPPAYQQKPLTAEHSSDCLYASDDPTSTSVLIRSRRPSHSSFLATSESESGDGSSIPMAHVATDDKAVLARLADLASAPPSEGSAQESSSQLPQVSAPEWRDEEMEEYLAQEGASDVVESSEGEAVRPTSSSAFPPPSEKVSLRAPNFYDYPYAFEEMDIAGMEPELGPSAPPFEERNSDAGPDGGAQSSSLVPSAPPMPEGDDMYTDLSPSAPTFPNPGADGEESSEARELSPSRPARESEESEAASQYTIELGPALPLYRP